MNKEIWISSQIRKEPSCDPQVILFIADFLYYKDIMSEEQANRFRNEYSYFFALMLKDAFKRGVIMYNPTEKFTVWIDEVRRSPSIAYGIDGIIEYDESEYIPIEFIGDSINAIKCIPCKTTYINDEYKDAIDKYNRLLSCDCSGEFYVTLDSAKD